ncbi:MAG: hypothetical protein ABIM02_07340 [candidate division WOR-3 bacterium]
MRKIPENVKSEVLRLWLNGLNYRDISGKLCVSLGSISSIINEARVKSPDLDELRELNVKLKKLGLSVLDAIRGTRLLERMEELGVGLPELDSFIEVASRMSSERGSEFIESALRLLELEKRMGKTYDEIVKDVDGMESRVRELRAEADRLRKDIEVLKVDKAKLNKDAEAMKNDIRKMVEAKDKLKKMDLDKLETLICFAENKMLMEAEVKRLREEVDKLSRVKRELEKENDRLAEKGSALFTLKAMLERKAILVPCRNCGYLISLPLRTRRAYNDMISRGLAEVARCIYCGYTNWFSPWDVLINLAWALISTG